MLWVKSHQRTWRIIILALLLIAMIGPWVYDRINVPSIYSCTGSVRLEGDFCGIPLSGIQIFPFIIGAVAGSAGRLIMGEAEIPGEFRNLYIGIILLLIFLPLLSLLIMSIRGDGKRFRWTHMLILGLAVLVLSWYSFLAFTSSVLNWSLWGIWLYLGLLLFVLLLEVFNHLESRKLKTAG